MDRWACVDAFCFPLQVLLSESPQWREQPVAVLDRDHPQGRIVHLNRRAQQMRLCRGMRYGQALGLVPHLRATAVDDALLAERSEELADLLTEYAPRIEPHDELAGLFWLDISGMYHLHPTWQQWVEPLRRRLREEYEIYVHVVVGFTRFGTFAVVRTTGRSGVFETPRRESEAARDASLSALGLEAQSLAQAHRLGLYTVDDLLAMPAEGVRRRLGEQAFGLHRMARNDLQRPRPSHQPEQAPRSTNHLDHVEKDRYRVVFFIKRHLQDLLDLLEKEGEKMRALHLSLYRGDSDPLESTIRPAEPTLDAGLIADLVRLRLESVDFDKGITDIVLTARGERTTTEQLRLFAGEAARDIDAANRALARLRAEFGPEAVLGVIDSGGHLPESRFSLERLDELRLPDSSLEPAKQRPAVRRFFPRPIHLRDPLPRGHLQTPNCTGPHILSGGWWIRSIHRDYQLVEREGRLLWIFYDHRRRRWYLHGAF